MRPLAGVVLLVSVTLAASACAGSHRGKSVAPMPGTVPSTPADVAIARVQASKTGADFRFFPNGETSSACLIPGPGQSRGIKGICTTRTSPHGANSGQTLVTFSEHWPWRAFHRQGAPRRTLHHRWVFDVLPSDKVTFATQSGDFPPNFAY
jgi:hypothetical protein